MNFWSSADYHRAKYHAKDYWNLREDFIDDFKHDAYGNGFISSAGLNYSFSTNWYAGFLGNYQQRSTTTGRNRTSFLADILDEIDQLVGTLPIVSDTRLNEVNWSS